MAEEEQSERGASKAAPGAGEKGMPLEKILARSDSFAALREQQHWESCGRQLDSKRPTRPCFSFGRSKDEALYNAAQKQPEGLTKTGRIREDVRCREIVQHPAIANPGPKYDLPVPKSMSTVPKGFGSERRFETKAEAPEGAVYDLGGRSPASPRKTVLTSGGLSLSGEGTPRSPGRGMTLSVPRLASRRILAQGASPFSSTFPYDEPALEPEVLEKEKSALNKLAALGLSPRKPNTTDPDLNAQRCRYAKQPDCKFGTAELDCRFRDGTRFSKAPERGPHLPRVGFRVLLNERIPVEAFMKMNSPPKKPSGED